MNISYTERGFALVRFHGANDQECSLQESSSADVPRVWLGLGNDRMHLTQEQVGELLPLLQHFVEHGELPTEEEATETPRQIRPVEGLLDAGPIECPEPDAEADRRDEE